MPRIAKVTARQIINSRGVPTVEATVELDNGQSASSSVASGSTANKLEAVELRDHNSQEYFGLGVSQAVNNVNTVISDALVGQDPLYQTQIDQILVNLDGTTTKARLGANAILATSQAVIKAAAATLHLPLFIYIKEKYQLINAYRIPTPIFNLMNGGAHGSGTLDFQEFQLVPASHLPYEQALRIGVEMFMALDRILEQKGAIRTVGVEGGYSPNLATNTDALEIFSEAMKLTTYTLAQDAFLGLDVAPKWFYKSGKYTVKDRPQPLTGKQMVKLYQDLHHQYRVFAFEDPLMPDAWADWKFMTAEMGQTAMIVADDLVTTNKTLLMKAIQEQSCNALVIKPNRIGTITETIEIANLAKQAGWHTIMSHRSGETTDDILADIAVGIGTDYVKFGAPSRGERVVKYNRLLRISEILLRSKDKDNSGALPMTDATTPSANFSATSNSGPNTDATPGQMMSTAAPAPLVSTPVTATVAPVAAPSDMPAPLTMSPGAPTLTAAPEPLSTPDQDMNNLQSNLDQLAQMAATTPTVAPAAVAPTVAPVPAMPSTPSSSPSMSDQPAPSMSMPMATVPLTPISVQAAPAPSPMPSAMPAPTPVPSMSTPVSAVAPVSTEPVAAVDASAPLSIPTPTMPTVTADTTGPAGLRPPVLPPSA